MKRSIEFYVYRHSGGNYLHTVCIDDGEFDNLLVTDLERATVFHGATWSLTEILENCGYEIVVETSYGHTSREISVAETDFTKHRVKMMLLD